MKFKSLFIAAGAAIAGIYLTSTGGKKAREALQKKKSAFEPVIKSLLKDANSILDGTKEIDSQEIRTNVSLLVHQAKKTLLDIDAEKTIEIIQEAIKFSSKKIRLAINEIQNTPSPKKTLKK